LELKRILTISHVVRKPESKVAHSNNSGHPRVSNKHRLQGLVSLTPISTVSPKKEKEENKRKHGIVPGGSSLMAEQDGGCQRTGLEDDLASTKFWQSIGVARKENIAKKQEKRPDDLTTRLKARSKIARGNSLMPLPAFSVSSSKNERKILANMHSARFTSLNSPCRLPLLTHICLF